MASFTNTVVDDAHRVLKSLPSDLDVMHKWVEEKFSVSVEEFRKSSKKSAAGTSNKTNRDLTNELRTFLSSAVDALFILERYVSSHIPQIEDGNNFGVGVQDFICKNLIKYRESICKYLDSLPDYFSTRATAVDKVLAKEVVTVTRSSSKSKSTGGKAEEAGEKTNDGDSKETKTTESKVLPDDLVEHIAALDAKQYQNLRFAAVDTLNMMSFVHSAITKNEKRIKNPKGSSGGGYMY